MKVNQALSGIVSVVMLFCVLCSCITVNAFATDGTENSQPVLTDDSANQDNGNLETLIEKQGTVTVSYSPPLLDAPLYLSTEEAGDAVRDAMKKRVKSVSLSIQTLKYFEEDDYVWLEVLSYAIMHTGVPTEGDYLLWNLYSYDAKISSYKNSVYNCYDITFKFEYLTTASQEAELDIAVKSVLDSLNLYEASDFDKIYGVYDYVCKNVGYDYEHANDDSYILMHSAYAALIDKATTTSGYVTLLYRLWLEMGIDNRIITGTIYGLSHAWNIFRYGSVYYNADPTLDAGTPQYIYLFRCNHTFFNEHKRDDAYKSDAFEREYDTASSDHKFQNIFFISDGIIIGYDGPYYNEIIIPDDEGIIGIGEYAFKGDYIESIVIPGNIKFIADNAFSGGGDLKSVTIFEGLEIIGDNAFSNCRWLNEVTLPESLISIGNSAFEGCTSLDNVVLPSSLKEIGSNAFEGCTNLSVITMQNSLEIIGEKAFYNTVIKQLVIPSSVTHIGDYAFASNTSLNKLTFESPASLTETGIGAFSGCSRLSTVEIPEGITHISQSSFSGCTSIKQLSLPSTLVSIGENAFNNALNLDSLVIPENVTEIGDYAFFNADVGELIINHDNLKFGPYTFGGDTTTNDHIYKLMFYTRNIAVPDGFSPYGIKINVFCYKNSTVWEYLLAKKYSRLYPFDVETPSKNIIDSGTCGENLTWARYEDDSVVISGTGKMTSEPWRRYQKNYSINSVYIVEGVTSITNNAFFECAYLRAIKLPSTIESIGYEAFNGSGISEIEIPDAVEVIETKTFSGCQELHYVKLPSQLKIINNGAFTLCKSLKEIILPNGLVTIGDYAFQHSSLKEIEIPESVETIGIFAFTGCTNLNKIVFLSDKTTIASQNSIPEHTVIYGYPGSTAHQFAKQYGRMFVSLAPGGELPGDLDCDGLVDNNDAIYLLYATIFGTEEYPLIQDCDYNKDNAINNDDAIYLLYHTIFSEDYPLN